MKSWKTPTPELVDRAVAQLAHGEHHRHFFDRLENPEWLIPLKEKGYFRLPPPPIADDTGPGFMLPIWPESRYLARMAKLAPETVAQILRSMPATENVRVHEDFLEAILVMSTTLSATFVPEVITWIHGRFRLLFPKKFGSLITHLSCGGQVDAALHLASALLALHADPRKTTETTETSRFMIPEPQALFDSWNYEQILENDIPNLVTAAPLPTLKLLGDLLSTAIDLSQRDEREREPDDYSYIWRPALDQPRYTGDNVRGMLVSATREAALQAIEQDRANIDQIVSNLESRKWRIFHRLAIDLLSLFGDSVPDLAAARLREPDQFDKPDFYREYRPLVKKYFGQLTSDEQAKTFNWIDKGPDVEALRAGWKRWTGKDATDEELAGYVKGWQRDRLAPLSAYLSGEWAQRYAKLVAELPSPQELEMLTNPKWGWTTPKGADELRELSIDALVDYLKSWSAPEPASPLGDSVEGLARAVGAAALSEPERFSREASRFVGLDPTYIRALLQAFWEAAQQKRSLNWESVLELCAWVVQQPRSMPGERGRITEQDPDWGWTRKTLANLFLRGFSSGAIPFEKRSECWRILEVLTDDPDPTPQDESSHNGGRDPANYSINTVRGEAMHAVMSYSRWVYGNTTETTDGANHSLRSFEEQPEVRTVIDKHLDPIVDPSAAIRSVYGQWFPWLVFLDPSWASSAVSRIFPSDEGSKDLHDAAWNTYIVYCPPSEQAFAILKEQYRRAIDRIEIPTDPDANRVAPDSRLAEHLMNLYWLGKLPGDDPDDLLALFYHKADPKLRQWALDFVGRSLRNTEEKIDPVILQRLQSLWAKRFQSIGTLAHTPADKKELAAFGWWFASRKFPDDWSLQQLLGVLKLCASIEPEHLVVEQLAELAVSYPRQAVESLALIVAGDKTWGVLGWIEHARKLLGQAINSDDQSARTQAIDLINQLGALGYSQFRDLVQ
jgi:hypothetical protein